MSTATPYDAQRQPAPITVVQTLLVLSAVGSAVGLVVSIYLAGVVIDLANRFAALSSLGGTTPQTTPEIGSSSELTVSAVLAVVEAIAVVAVSIWAFRAVAQARSVARVVLATLAAAQVVLTVTSTLVAGAGVGLVVVTVVVGLLVFDAPVLVLLFVPAESRRWFGHVAPSTPTTQAPSRYPAPSWGPPTSPGPSRNAPFPAARDTGPFPQPPARGPAPDRPPHPPAGGRHAAPRPPQH